MSSFAEEMECEARLLVSQHVPPSVLEELFGGDVPNFKPWYSPKWMYEPIEGGVERVFLGVYPSTNREFKAGQVCDKPRCDHERLAYVNHLQSCCPYNDWLDSGCWGPHGKRHQTKARNVFKSLYGESEGVAKFRFARCTNACPMRMKGGYYIPQTVWDDWIRKLLNGLRPKTIICNGYGEDGDSPWATVNRLYQPRWIPAVTFGESMIKLAGMSFDGSDETMVIGITSLNGRYFRSNHYDALRIVATKYNIA